jgi:hypothetical protein
VNYSTFIGVHFTEYEWCTASADSISCELGHRTQFGLARCAKAFDITNHPLALGKFSSKRLRQKVLHGLQNLAALGLQKSGVRSTQIQQALGRGFMNGNL